jgi:hypothetical protein
MYRPWNTYTRISCYCATYWNMYNGINCDIPSQTTLNLDTKIFVSTRSQSQMKMLRSGQNEMFTFEIDLEIALVGSPVLGCTVLVH